MKNYGNTFNTNSVEPVGVERIAIWKSAREFFPSGVTLTKDDYTNVGLVGTTNVGDIVPAGTPIFVEKPGGKPTFNGDTPLGLTYEDVQLGTDACTFTIVTMGEFLESRTQANITETQKSHLFGRISFIKEV